MIGWMDEKMDECTNGRKAERMMKEKRERNRKRGRKRERERERER
jgi:hypothetical protein